MRAAALFVLVACAPTPPALAPLPTAPSIERCPPSLNSSLSRLAILEPGRQSFQAEFLAARLCVDAGTIPPESVTVSVTTETGANVVEQARVELAKPNTIGGVARSSIDLQLDIPSDAKRVTFVVVVEPTIGVLRHTVPVAPLVTLSFRPRARAQCAAVLPWLMDRAICVQYNEASFLEGDGGATPLGPSGALAVTPSGLWSVSTGAVSFFPSDGGSLVLWQQRVQPRAIATLGDRVFLGADDGVTELIPGKPLRFWSLGPPSAFPPSAIRVEPPELIIARQERIDRVPLASFPELLGLPVPTRSAVMNFNSVAGLWKVEGQRIELATDAGVLFVDVPHVLTAPSDQLVTNEPPALADETPLLTIGVTQAGRPVWLQPLEDLDAGRLTVRYLVAPPGQMLGRADSEHVFASGAEGVSWAARR